jgi:hypothetical protein
MNLGASSMILKQHGPDLIRGASRLPVKILLKRTP